MQETPDYWQDPIDLRPRYRICRVGFSLAAFSYALFALDGFGLAMGILRRDRGLLQFLTSPFWQWAVEAPITWGTFLGSWLLLGRFREPSWRRRSVILVLMNTMDLIFWGIEHAEALGLPRDLHALRGGPSLSALSPLLNLAQVTLYAGLAGDLIDHLGDPEESRRRQRAIWMAAGLAAFFWIGFQLHAWDFRPGQPPRFRGIRNLETFRLYLTSSLAQSVSCLLVCLLCGRAAMLNSQILRAIDEEHAKHQSDPFESPIDRD